MTSNEMSSTLAGSRVLITRAADQADSFAALLAEQGAETIELAVLTIGAPENQSELDRSLKTINSYDWIVFASRNAVEYSCRRLSELALPAGSSWGNRPKVASIGPGTSEALKASGIEIAFEPSNHIAESMVQEFPGYPHLSGLRVFWPRTNIGRPVISDGLAAAGAQVDTAVAYETGFPPERAKLSSQLLELLQEKRIDIITLASAQTARNLACLLKDGLKEKCGSAAGTLESEFTALLAGVKLAAIGPITARAAEEELGRIDIVAAKHTLPGLIEALLASLKLEQNPL